MRKTVSRHSIPPASLVLPFWTFLCLASCRHGDAVEASRVADTSAHATYPRPTAGAVDSAATRKVDAATVLSRRAVPILCYHQVREWKATDSRSVRELVIPPDRFRSHMKALADSGYRTILPDQLLGYLTRGDSLPGKPVMVTFDDGSAGQYHFAMKELERYGFRGVFYIMTISIDRPGYMTQGELKDLSDRGHVIASHSWNHKNVQRHDSSDWRTQLEDSKQRLERITGRPVDHFAYPYGLWDGRTVEGLRKAGYRTAVILSTKRDSTEPLFTIRRVMVPGDWSGGEVLAAMRRGFR